jgi:hypothetical protein
VENVEWGYLNYPRWKKAARHTVFTTLLALLSRPRAMMAVKRP